MEKNKRIQSEFRLKRDIYNYDNYVISQIFFNSIGYAYANRFVLLNSKKKKSLF